MRIPSNPRAAALSLASLGALAGSAGAQSTVIISDTFETDTSADYTIVDDGTPNGTQAFNWDYVAAGIPLAPRSQAGDTGGLRCNHRRHARRFDTMLSGAVFVLYPTAAFASAVAVILPLHV